MRNKFLIAIAGSLMMGCNSNIAGNCHLEFEELTPASIRENVNKCEPHTTFEIRTRVEGLLEHYLTDDLLIAKAHLGAIETLFEKARQHPK